MRCDTHITPQVLFKYTTPPYISFPLPTLSTPLIPLLAMSLALGTRIIPVTTFPSLPPVSIKFQILHQITPQTYSIRVRHSGSHLGLPHGSQLHLKLLPMSTAQNELLVYCHLKGLQGKMIPRCYGMAHLEGGSAVLLEPLWGFEIENRSDSPFCTVFKVGSDCREEFFIKALRGLYTLHEHGVVHSHPTLANFLLCEDGSVRIHGFESAVVYYQMKSVFFQRGVNSDLDLFEDSFRERGYLPAQWKGEMYDPRIVRLPLSTTLRTSMIILLLVLR